jgi:hypothetical protein
MQTWKHKNIEITFDAGGAYFKAELLGKWVTAGSLEGMKKKIDKAMTNSFEAFDALEFPTYYRQDVKVEPIKVTGIAKDNRRSWNSRGFAYKNSAGYDVSTMVLVPDTIEARQLIEEYYAIAKKRQEESARLDALLEVARKKIPTIQVMDYLKAHPEVA